MVVKQGTMSKRADLLLKVAMAFLSPLVLMGLLEGMAYLWEREQANSLYAWELVASRRLVWETYTEPGAGYTLMKPNSSYEWQGIPVEINSKGLRTPETPYEKPADTFRILNLGDSVVMGWGVREEETYGRRLEQWLNQQSDDDLRYEVINAGVPGWNLENALSYLQVEGLRYEPDIILLDLTTTNDIRGKSALLANSQPAVIQWLRDHTYFWPYLTIQLRWFEARMNGRERIDVIAPPTAPDKYYPLDPNDEQWTKLWNQLLAIYQVAEENNVRLAIVLFPLEFQVLDENYSTLPQELLADKALGTGIPLLDLLPAFRQACREKLGGVCQLEDRYLFADVWMHPSAYGHDVTATEIETFLTGNVGTMQDNGIVLEEN